MELTKISIDEYNFELPKKFIFLLIDVHNLSNVFEARYKFKGKKYVIISHVTADEDEQSNNSDDNHPEQNVSEEDVTEEVELTDYVSLTDNLNIQIFPLKN